MHVWTSVSGKAAWCGLWAASVGPDAAADGFRKYLTANERTYRQVRTLCVTLAFSGYRICF